LGKEGVEGKISFLILQGDWSDSSSLWNSVSSSEKERIGFKIEDDGTFFMNYFDFCKFWTSLDVCWIFYENKYLKQSFEGFFKIGETSGSYKNIKECPQYLIEINNEFDQFICISLMQSDKRVSTNQKKKNISMGIQIFESKNGEIIMNNDEVPFKSVKKFSFDREIILEENLPTGKYIIVPSTFDSKMESKYCLRIFSDCLFEVKPIHPLNSSELDWKLNQQRKIKFTESVKPFIRMNLETEFPIFKWETKSDDISLSNEYRTVTHCGKDSIPVTFFSDRVFKSGKHYFSLKVNRTNHQEIMFGVIKEYNLIQDSFLSYQPFSWCYYLKNGVVFNHFESKQVGYPCKENDEVGMLLDLQNSTLEFFLNGESFGTCFREIYGGIKIAVTLYTPGDQISTETLPSFKPSNAGIFENETSIYLRSKSGEYVTLNKLKKFIVKNSLGPHSIFTISKNQHSFNISCGNEILKEIMIKKMKNSKINGYTIESLNGDFFGISNENTMFPNCSFEETRFFPEPISNNPIQKIFKNGSIIMLKSKYETFLCYEKSGKPITTKVESEENLFEVGKKFV
jgi:hypothetical protein